MTAITSPAVVRAYAEAVAADRAYDRHIGRCRTCLAGRDCWTEHALQVEADAADARWSLVERGWAPDSRRAELAAGG